MRFPLFAAALALVGCLTEPGPKSVDHQFAPEDCYWASKDDYMAVADTMICVYDPEPKPPGAPQPVSTLGNGGEP